MLRLLLIFLGGWLAISTVLGLFLGRVMGAHNDLEPSIGAAPRERFGHPTQTDSGTAESLMISRVH
jgi:hypothetical protein